MLLGFSLRNLVYNFFKCLQNLVFYPGFINNNRVMFTDLKKLAKTHSSFKMNNKRRTITACYSLITIILMVDPQMISVRVMESICKQKDDFALKGSLQTPIKSSPSTTTSNSQCGWFDKKRQSHFTKCRGPKMNDNECKFNTYIFYSF